MEVPSVCGNSPSVQRDLYPDIEPFDVGFLKVSERHELYYEQSGNKNGKPVVYLHGGPGSGTNSRDRRFFDPDVYRIILFDQRGSGQSKPPAELEENTTWDLVEDIEKLRKHLSVDKWVVFGGSWGSTLSLVYAQLHPANVVALVLRGIFTSRRREISWLYQDGANRLFPDAFESFTELIPQAERYDLLSAYHRRLTDADPKVQLVYARRWCLWDLTTLRLLVDPDGFKKVDSDLWSLQHAKIEAHYFVNGSFLRNDSHILDDVEKIRHIPCTIVQGRYDITCPPETAWELHKLWPEAEYFVVPDAGHSTKELGIATCLLDATDKYKTL